MWSHRAAGGECHIRLAWVTQPYEWLGPPRKNVERTELVIDALAAAERTRGSLAGAVMHTDHGSKQYTSRAFAEICRSAGSGRA